ncbi:MAG: FecR domain-containing protein [Prolixibacteraceae bacterium]|nr:FecR domain-containing protein [Prolixibacteraceae bacterium]
METAKWDIIAKYLNGETLTKNESTYIEEALSNEQLKQLIADSGHTLNNIDNYYQLKQFDTNAAWEKVNAETKTNRITGSSYKYLMRYAAIFILLVSTTLLALLINDRINYTYIRTTGNSLQTQTFVLPDSSTVTLNHNTKLKYPKKFDDKARKIKLKGEAFFNVEPMPHKPFIVETSKARVQVLGTSFNVNAYPQNNKVEVYVETGKVAMHNKQNEANMVLLSAGDKATLEKNSELIVKKVALQNNFLAWKTRQIFFESTSLSEVIETLEHTFGLKLNIANDVDLNQAITATFNQQEPDYILDVVALTLQLEIKKDGDYSYSIQNK